MKCQTDLAAPIKLYNCLDHIREVTIGEFRVNRKRQHLFSGLFRYGEGALLIAEVFVAVLEVHWERVINFRTDSLVLEIGSEIIALGNADGVLIVHVKVPRLDD